MNKRLFVKYIILYIPPVIGGSLFLYGIVNIFSSLLFFLGGYIALKNSLDYRLIRKNVEKCRVNENVSKRVNEDKGISYNNVIGLKRVRRYSRVRRRY